LFLSLIVGFLLLFFYQTMVDSQLNRFKANYNFFSSSGDESFLLLRGWRAKKEGDLGYVVMTAERSIFICSISEQDAIALTFKYRTNEADQQISVYKDNVELGILKPQASGEWVEDYIIIDNNLVDEGLIRLNWLKQGKLILIFMKLRLQIIRIKTWPSLGPMWSGNLQSGFAKEELLV